MTPNPSQIAKDHNALVRFVLESASNEPAARRISIYRGLAEVCGDDWERQGILALAAELEAVEQHYRQFTFNFTARVDGILTGPDMRVLEASNQRTA